MAWFRRRSSDPTPAPPAEAAADADAAEVVAAPPGTDLVPLVSGQSLARTERALKMLAAQSAQLHSHVVSLERRVDALSDALLDRLDVPSQGDLLEARMHSARVAAELSRLEVNLAARLDAVRDELRVLQGAPTDIDLRALVPTDTGWTPAR
ncbi:MAG TPA: hypothetical protein VFU14_13310 [Acidimicrobiales bacterium]|nr:hypothetical protein [Acidimicrobiales bacterium]